MLNSLRNRLIISHLLPSLIIIPLVGVILAYALESRILLPTLTRELSGDAMLLAEIFRNQPGTWQDPEAAASALLEASPKLGGRVMLLDGEGHLLASSDPADAERIGSILAVINELSPEQADQTVTLTGYSPSLEGEVIDVIVPVIDPDQGLLGRVRITYLYDTVYEELYEFRYLLGAILFVALLVGAAIGYVLALNISIPIQYVAVAIHDLATGEQKEPLPLVGPDEIKVQIRAVNFLVARLDGLEKARRQLLANLVHEFGRPLGAIRSGLQALLRGATQDPVLLDELLIGMKEQTERLQILLDDLAHLHDQVLGTLELARQPLALSQWLPRTLRPWLEVAQNKEQQYEMAIPADLPTIDADPTRLAQALDNLVNNAIKYTPAGGTITVSAGTKGDEVWIRVSDDGPGIPFDEQQHIFEPFFRGDRERRIKQGMGLGLSIAHDLVVAHAGYLELESQPGQGSQFTIWIPQKVPSLDDINPQSK